MNLKSQNKKQYFDLFIKMKLILLTITIILFPFIISVKKTTFLETADKGHQ